MNFYFFWFVLLFGFTFFAFGAVLGVRHKIAARKRRDLLAEEGRICAWQDIGRRPERFIEIVQTNIGYGSEIWALTVENDHIDDHLLVFENGILIAPQPRLSELRTYCHAHGIKFYILMVKSNAKSIVKG